VFARLRRFRDTGDRSLPPGPAERLEMGLRHLALLADDSGPETAAREMRKHVAWYIKGLPGSARVREQVNRTRSVEEMSELLRSYLERLERDGLEAFADEAPGLACSSSMGEAVATG
jgi:tRNA-dihydrouridine synthase